MKTLEEINLMELNNDWYPALTSLTERTESNMTDKESWLRQIFLLWYLLLERGSIKHDLAEDYLQSKLIEQILVSRKLFVADPEYLFLLGYMMNLTSWYFQNPKLPASEEIAIDLLKKANEAEPENPLYEWALLGAQHSDTKGITKFNILREKLKDRVHSFSVRGTLGRYFSRMILYNPTNENP